MYDLFIWIFRVFFRREGYLHERLKVMARELHKRWPYPDTCLSHISEEEKERLRKSTFEFFFEEIKKLFDVF